MKGLILFVAGLVCGGLLIAWLFLRDPVAPAPSGGAPLPVPAVVADSATGVVPGADDLAMPPIPEALAEPEPGSNPPPALALDPLERVDVPIPQVPPLPPRVAERVDPPAGADAPAPAEATAPAADPPQAVTPPDPAVLAALRKMTLLMPVQGIEPAQLSDTYSDARGEGRSHDAIDIMAPTGRPVRAVADGRIAKLFDSVPGGLTIYQFDAQEQVAFYYAHLDRYAEGVVEGQEVKRGDLIGYVGWTGNASEAAPHLHFAIFVLGPEKKWWQGTAVNPYPVLKRATAETSAP